MGSSVSTRQALVEYIRKHGSATGPELARAMGVTRQAISLHIRRLLAERKIVKTGSTRAARYHPPEAAPEGRKLERKFELDGLDEARVYEEFKLTLNLGKLRENVESIVHYAFTEMLNNAIDHSGSRRCLAGFLVDATRVRFTVRDYGVGVYYSIADKFELADEHAAMVELIKGKTTTQPDRHSGEGIFFVSRVADFYVLRSHRIRLEWNRYRDDVFAEDAKFLKGTSVEFEIQRDSRRRLEDTFDAFAPEEYDYRFEKTRVFVKLLQRSYVSRSEARRLLHKLDRFAEIELDMREVTNVGQGFVDEVFRVFANEHPDIAVRAVNCSNAVTAMIRHAGGRAVATTP